jgi:diguanylate cyclase (GGDEF)-like protein
VGAEIIGAVPFPYPVAPLIASHHERWDGRGYPQKLRGEDIPLGARILAVVDYFDALTSERPYHTAQTTEEAVATIAAEAGKALDPQVVQAFIERLPQLELEAERLGEPSQRLSFAAGTGSSAARTVGVAPQGATKAFQDIALAHREISALYEIAQGLGTTLSVSEAMELISTKLNHLVPFATSALFLYDEEHDLLRCRHASGADAELMQQISLKLGQGLIGWVARNRRPLVNARPSADFEAAGVSDATTLNAALVCPLIFDGRLVGALALYHPQSGCYNDDHRRLLDRVCEQAAGVVNNAVLFERTKHDSLTDALTGLPNARYMLVHLTRELARAERLNAEVTLFVMDLDGFKTINDQYGHHVGDRALREVAHVLRSGIRPYDICVRYAGDEFVVVLSGCGPDEAEHKRRELQQAIEEIPFEVRPGRFFKLGSSFGAASFPRDGRSHETLLATADQRMYEDKAERKRAREQETQAPPDSTGRAKRPSVFAKIETRPATNRTH